MKKYRLSNDSCSYLAAMGIHDGFVYQWNLDEHNGEEHIYVFDTNALPILQKKYPVAKIYFIPPQKDVIQT